MSVTIEQAMQKIVALAGNAVAHAREGSTQWAEQTIEDLEATLSALVSQARDEEAEACAEVVEAIPKMAAFMSDMPVQDKCAQAIRARIAGRKA